MQEQRLRVNVGMDERVDEATSAPQLKACFPSCNNAEFAEIFVRNGIVDPQGRTLAFEHEAFGALDENGVVISGAYEVVLSDVSDQAGNKTSEINIGTITIDAQAPIVLSVEPEESLRKYRGGDTIGLTVQVSETLNEPPTAVLDNSIEEVCTLSNGVHANAYECTIFLPADDEVNLADGIVPVVLTLTDLAQNISYESIPVTLDTLPPQVEADSSLPKYRQLQQAVVTFTSNEPLNAETEPQFVLLENGENSSKTYTITSPNSSTFVLTMDEEFTAMDSGSYTIQGSGFTDVAGNVSENTVSVSFEVDTVAPLIKELLLAVVKPELWNTAV